MARIDDFTIGFERRDGTVVARVSGELDIATASSLVEQLASRTNGDTQRVVLDLAGLSFIDAGGLRAVLASRQQVVANGSSFQVTNPQPAVRRLLQLTDTHQLLLGDLTATSPQEADIGSGGA